MDILGLTTQALPWILLSATAFVLALLIYFFESRSLKKKFDVKELKIIENLEERNKAFVATVALNTIILQTLDFDQVAQLTANAIPQFLGYQTGVLAIVNEKKNVLRRVAISETLGGKAALEALEVPFTSIEIKLYEDQNYCIKALKKNKTLSTTHLYDVLRPAISEENAQKVQNMMGTITTLIYPIYSFNKKPLGVFLVSMDKTEDKLSEYERQTISNFVDGVRIALTNSIIYTSLKKTTRQLEEANRRLKEFDKLKDEFVSLASHELRTPMTVIKSYVWLLLQGKAGAFNEKQKLYLDRTYASTDRLINLVNDMLNVSRIESGRLILDMKPVRIIQLVQDVISEMQPRAQELEVSLRMQEISGDLPLVLADSGRIKEVLINLIGNSIKFTPKSGHITISLFEKDGMVVTQVHDTGMGIKQEDIPNLFQKFGIVGNNYRIKINTQGTGLGLYISKSIIKLHGGKIWAQSEGEGKGTTFSFSLKTVKEGKP